MASDFDFVLNVLEISGDLEMFGCLETRLDTLGQRSFLVMSQAFGCLDTDVYQVV